MKQANRFTTEGAHPRVITDGFDLAKKEALKVCLLSGFFLIPSSCSPSLLVV